MSHVEHQDGRLDERRGLCDIPDTTVSGTVSEDLQLPTLGDGEGDPGHLPGGREEEVAAGLQRAGPVQDFSSHHYGHKYYTLNEFHGSANVISHAENVGLGANAGLLALNGFIPQHPRTNHSKNRYLPNSRPEDEKVVWNWINSSVGSLVLWIHGPAGIGKSTLAHHIQQELRFQGRLAAAIFLGAFGPNPPTPENIIWLIAGELGRMHDKAIPAILEACRQCHELPPETLVEKVILDVVRSLRLPQPLIAVLDATDEWPSHEAFMQALSSLNPSVIRFLVLGRLEPQGRAVRNLSIKRQPLAQVSSDVIRSYINWRLDQVDWTHGPRPSSYDVGKLAEKADGLFIWAVTACALLEDKLSPTSLRSTIEAILGSRRSLSESDDLAALYRSAILLLFPRTGDQGTAGAFLGAIMVLQEPLPLAAFSRLVGMRESVITEIQRCLKALQIRQPHDHNLKVHPASSLFHLSLIEYFSGAPPEGDPTFSISILNSHARFAEAGLQELVHLPSVVPESPTLTLSPFHHYIVKYLALHLSNGAPEVKPGSTSDWEESQLCSALRETPISALRQWGLLLLRLVGSDVRMPARGDKGLIGMARRCRRRLLRLVESGTETATRESNDDGKGALMMDMAHCLSESDHLQPFRLPCLGIAVRILPDHEKAWHALGEAYLELAKTSIATNAIQGAVTAFRNGLGSTVKSKRVGIRTAMGSLARALTHSFEHSEAFKDLCEAVELQRELLTLYPRRHPSHLEILVNLSNCIIIRYRRAGSDGDIREAIKMRRVVLALCPDGDPHRPLRLKSLAYSLQSRYEKTGSDSDLQEAIELGRGALALCPDGHFARSLGLNTLAHSLQSRYEKTGSDNDLQEAIELWREALALCPDGHPDRSLTLNNLAYSLQSQYMKSGSDDDLWEAIELQREALALCPNGHPDRSVRLNNLASSLHCRYKKTGSDSDLQEAIELGRGALALCPDGHFARSLGLNTLAHSLQSRYEKTGSDNDLQEAIELQREALALCPNGHPDRSLTLGSLADSLQSQYMKSGSDDDLWEAIELQREALALCPNGHPDRSLTLNNLADSLESQYEKTGSDNDLRQAIELRRELLTLRPPGHRRHHRALKNLAKSLRLAGTDKALEEAASLEEAARSR